MAVIFDDAELDLAVAELTRVSLVMAGQICVAAARCLVHEAVLPTFRDRIAEAFSAVKVGPGGEPDSRMGALIDKPNQARLEGLIEKAGDEGRMVLRGSALDGALASGHTRLLAEAETGGYSQSCLGRLHGTDGLNDFLETKHVCLKAGAV